LRIPQGHIEGRIRELLRIRSLRRVLLVVGCWVLVTGAVFGQAVGDFGSRYVGPSNWGTASNWLICQSAGTWTGATVAGTIPGSGTNVWIRDGHTMTLNSATRYCANLNVAATAQIAGDQAFYIYGTLVINGTINTTNQIRLYGNSLDGSGSISSTTFRLYNAGTNKIISVSSNISLTSSVEFRADNTTITNNGSLTLNGT